MTVVDIRKSGAVLIRDRKFLVTRAHDRTVFVAPGGKLDPGETHIDALRRELMEEIQVTVRDDDIEELGTFQALAAGKQDKMLEMKVFLVHDWQGEVTPANEIEEIRWIDSSVNGIEIGSIFEHDVMPQLKEKGLID